MPQFELRFPFSRHREQSAAVQEVRTELRSVAPWIAAPPSGGSR